LEGNLALPEGAHGIVLFAHGSGSSRHSPRNRSVAKTLQQAGLGTLLLDLLTSEEEVADRKRGHLRFDIPFLAERLISVSDWLRTQPGAVQRTLGYFGASTGGAAALVAAALRPELVHAVISRGGRPDLAGDLLPRVKAPTLLLVGEKDRSVIALNEAALERMRVGEANVRMEIIPGATHLFEEPGTLEIVARLSADWFRRHLASEPCNSKE
jgi:dienelactone hydrolase